MKFSLHFGNNTFPDLAGATRLARLAEAAGFDSVFAVDHVVIPGAYTSTYPYAASGRLPGDVTASLPDPLIWMAAAMAITTRLRFMTGVIILPLRHPMVLAKQVATLDVLSAGRVDLGVGVGWQKEEYDAQGLDFSQRGRLLEETIAACRALWSDLPAKFDSGSVSFEDTFCSPQPAQPRLPVWFGGTLSDRMLARITELGDGWIPIMGATLDDVREGAERLRTASSRPIDVQMRASTVMGADGKPDPVATLGALPELVAAGVTDVTVNLAAFAPTLADAPAALASLGKAFGEEAR